MARRAGEGLQLALAPQERLKDLPCGSGPSPLSEAPRQAGELSCSHVEPPAAGVGRPEAPARRGALRERWEPLGKET